MKPLRILLKGFMCYHDETEISFDGAPLWVLSGPNGSGKSAIFDAMTFALYGTFRGDDDRRDGRELINHNSDNLYVQFDFEVGHDQYRVIRGLGEKKTARGIFRAIHLNPPGGGNGEIKEVNDKKSLTEWVIKQIGLEKDAFVTSVLLRQGQADILLSLSDTKRKDIVKQLVNITAYEKLYIEADKVQKDFESEIKGLDQQLTVLDKITLAELAQIETELKDSELERDTSNQQLIKLEGLKVSAKLWQELKTKKGECIQRLIDLEPLLSREVEIEANQLRYSELDKVTPLFRQLWNERERIVQIEKDKDDYNLKAEQYVAYISEANIKLGELVDSQISVKTQKQEAEDNLGTVRQQQLALAESAQDLKTLEEYSELVAKGERIIAEYSAQLDEEIVETSAKKEKLEEIDRALPLLLSFNRQRGRWQLARQNQMPLRVEIAQLETDLHQTKSAKASLELNLAVAQGRCNLAQQAEADINAHQKTIQQRLDRFKMVDGQPECTYCGQALTEKHLAEERQKLNRELVATKSKADQAQNEKTQAENQNKELELQYKEVKEKIQNFENIQTTKNGDLQASTSAENEADEEAKRVYFALPENFQCRVCPNQLFSLESCAAFPTTGDINWLENEVNGLENIKKALGQLENNQKYRDLKVAELTTPKQYLAELQKKYPEEKVASIRKTLEEVKQKIDSFTVQINSFTTMLRELEEKVTSRQDQVKEYEKQEQNLRREAEQVTGQLKILRQNVTKTLEKLEPKWQSTVISLTLPILKEFEAECDKLAIAPEEYKQLGEARSSQTFLKSQLNQVVQDLNRIPEAAHQSMDALSLEETRLIKIRKETEARVSTLVARHTKAAETIKTRSILEEKRVVASQEANLYKRLVGYLDKKHLQQWLLGQSQIAIKDNANQILDRISGGMLQLELRQAEQNEDDLVRGEVLDLVVHNRETNGRSLSTDLLSGSQRFRVAVSLAIGIGQYASHRAQPIRSIIIDEGFGSLDKSGRDEIIEEIYRLQDSQIMELIILVSHQEEFFKRFTHGWSTRLENGVAKVQLI